MDLGPVVVEKEKLFQRVGANLLLEVVIAHSFGNPTVGEMTFGDTPSIFRIHEVAYLTKLTLRTR